MQQCRDIGYYNYATMLFPVKTTIPNASMLQLVEAKELWATLQQYHLTNCKLNGMMVRILFQRLYMVVSSSNHSLSFQKGS